jgi:multiple sugar transport system substrate-binding protein
MKFERDGNRRYTVCTPAFLEGIRTGREIIFRQGIVPSFVSESDTDTERLFLQQKVSMIITTYFGLNYLRDAEFVYDVSPLPHLSEPSTLLLIVGLAVNRNSSQKQAVQTLLRYLLSERIQSRIRMNTLSLPAHKRAAEWVGEDERLRPARFHMYREVIPTFRLFTDMGLSRRQLDIITNELRLYWSQMENETSICNRLEELL